MLDSLERKFIGIVCCIYAALEKMRVCLYFRLFFESLDYFLPNL